MKFAIITKSTYMDINYKNVCDSLYNVSIEIKIKWLNQWTLIWNPSIFLKFSVIIKILIVKNILKIVIFFNNLSEKLKIN